MKTVIAGAIITDAVAAQIMKIQKGVDIDIYELIDNLDALIRLLILQAGANPNSGDFVCENEHSPRFYLYSLVKIREYLVYIGQLVDLQDD